MYLNDLFVVNKNGKSRRQFLLVQPHFTIIKYGFKSLCYQAGHFWNLLDNFYKDPTTLYGGGNHSAVVQIVIKCFRYGIKCTVF